MAGLIAVVCGFAILAGLCAYLITYDDALHRFSRHQARIEGARTGVVATGFFVALGIAIVLLFFH